ncbi:protein-disulfide reductase DsbD domain-containing protein [Hoeflea sp. AS60]|uniref:protein-disulfide reductase DsbD domain-containing protein n=1 Tax=Hoeflea sp. AS60 TaxID=3135780 RepID=UPI003181D995
MLKRSFISEKRPLLLGLFGQVIALALSLGPAWSLDSGWAEAEGGRMRLVIDPVTRDNGTLAGFLDIDLEPGWKTYWRDPGSAGIPPMLDFSQSQGIAFEVMHFPPPVRVDDGYAIWAGYTAPVQLPLIFKLTASGEAHIRAQAFIGICEKICVPFQAEFIIEVPADMAADPSVSQAVDAAFARLPAAAGTDFNIEKAVVDTTGKQLTIAARLPAFRPSGVAPELFVAGPEGFAFAPPKLTSDNDGLAEWSVRVETPSGMVTEGDAVPLDIVVTLGQRAVEQSVSVSLVAKN